LHSGMKILHPPALDAPKHGYEGPLPPLLGELIQLLFWEFRKYTSCCFCLTSLCWQLRTILALGELPSRLLKCCPL
jgi:hypothetical protein